MLMRLLVAVLVLLAAPSARAEDLRARVEAAHEALRAAILDNDPAARARLYRPDAISAPEYQPRLFGAEAVAAYHRAIAGRMRVTAYTPETREVIDLGPAAVETGHFTIAWTNAAGEARAERGKFVHVWSVEPGGLRLKADAWGYFRPLPDSKQFFVALPPGTPPSRDTSTVGLVLDGINAVMAFAVKVKDPGAQIGMYTDDAIFMPFANTPKEGIAAIREHLTAYVAQGSGADFDRVEVGNIGFEDHGRYVVEYPKFRVDWRAGESSGTVTGGGLRLWRREADGTLKLHRQIGTHDETG
jgi:ketosteroid isomerase-like protein